MTAVKNALYSANAVKKKLKEIAALVRKKQKKNCFLCIKNEINFDNQDFYEKICSIKDISIVTGPN